MFAPPAPWAYTPFAGHQADEGLGAGAGAPGGGPAATPVGPGSYGGIDAYGGPASGQWHVPPPAGAAYAFPTSPQPATSGGLGFLTGDAWHGVPLASWGQRAGAWFIDALAAYVPMALPLIIAVTSGNSIGAAGVVLLCLVAIGWPVGYVVIQVAGEGSTGQGLGKRLVGIRVVQASDGQVIGSGQAFGRQLLHLLDWLPSCLIVLPLGFLWPLWHNKRQTWADMLLGTVVIRSA
ncbi:RDD family protein [Streptomyces sp. NBC_00377]|uniref:RDD family protein n=1 Tax=unclassified Streptomyces TaxID=2593676 RepID=UPI002E1B208B|nr:MULTISPECIES: RDD family protein [unclassified Streptomyces]